MKKLMLVALASLLTAAPALAQQPVANPDQDAVRAAVRAFKEALSSGDSLAALELLHDDVLILEGNRTETKAQYRSSHLAADIRAVSGMQNETVREGVTIHGDVALYTRVYRVTGTNARGAQVDRTNNEAMVLVRTPAGWHIRNIHWF